MRIIPFIILFFACSPTFGQSKSYSFVFLHKKAAAPEIPKEQLDQLMEGHMANINRLAKEGKLVAAGPFEGGGGIFVLNTSSIDEATQWLSSDPGVQAKRWDIEILPYTPRIRSICAVKEPYEMVVYHFVRFIPGKTARQESQPLYSQHAHHINLLEKKGNIVTEGTFGIADGGIVVLNGELNKEFLESDPAVVEGLFTLDFKKLWIAKGSFCEK